MMIAAGQEFSETIIERIRSRVSGDEGISRTRLSQEVCEWLDWRHKDGRVKEMNCRMALKGLEQAGVIELPAARAGAFFQRREPAPEPVEEWPVVAQSLKELGPVWLEEIKAGDQELSRKWWALMEAHPLKGGPLCGAQIRYLIVSRAGYLGGLSFSSAAFRLAARDRWIGWNEEQRKAGRERVVANSRFLLLPTVEVPHLASHVVGIALRRLADDWEARYGTRPALVETFVDPKEQSGTCYRAANWLCLGETSGRGRQGQRSGREAAQNKKQIWIYPLTKASRGELNGGKATPAPAPRWPLARAEADWAEAEFSRCELGDARLQQRVTVLARDFYARPNANLPQACGSRAKTKAAYRFFDQEIATMKNLLAGHYAAAAERMSPQKVVLAVQDTTSLNYTTHREMKGLGPIHTSATGAQGLLLHTTHAFALDGRALGYLDAQIWARDPEESDKKPADRNRPIEEKESVIWLRSYRAVAELQPQMPATLLVSVGDREADIYELFRLAEETPGGPKLLVRSKSDRCLEEEQGRLKATLAALPVAGTYPLRVPRKGKQKARDTVMEIRFARVTLKAPRRQLQADKTAPSLPVWAVLAQEVEPPPKGITPLKWLLLTTVEVNNYQAAEEKVRWYQMRWSIEDLHRTIKSGCRIEQRQLGAADRLEACLAIDLVVAWRIYALKRLARQDPDAPCTVYFQDHEWQALVVFITRVPVPPEHPPSLRDATRMVAQLGGFLGRKSDGEPGTQTLWLGLQRLDDIANIFQFLRESMAATQPSVSSHTYG